jgi:hypothetical protein
MESITQVRFVASDRRVVCDQVGFFRCCSFVCYKCETRSVIGRNKTLVPSLPKSSKNTNPTQSKINLCLEFSLYTLLGLERIRITQSKLWDPIFLEYQSKFRIRPLDCPTHSLVLKGKIYTVVSGILTFVYTEILRLTHD